LIFEIFLGVEAGKLFEVMEFFLATIYCYPVSGDYVKDGAIHGMLVGVIGIVILIAGIIVYWILNGTAYHHYYS